MAQFPSLTCDLGQASVPKQVERFHAELLQHIDMVIIHDRFKSCGKMCGQVDSITLKTQERDLTISLGNLRLADFFSAVTRLFFNAKSVLICVLQPSEDVPAVSIDLHPLQVPETRDDVQEVHDLDICLLFGLYLMKALPWQCISDAWLLFRKLWEGLEWVWLVVLWA